ncbi:nitrile hydratase accessory protein [Cognatishimia sp. 1_MG-2023]|uniref:nitrile hydratase accessory protein n=1 Tax=Cognatishimia sp. 1_MG-2023 TaxID=3062642 RepID=UPI0026E436F1|nr:nitrile hydratase accessory protein [Cognatishimia sp. 1_MG-2023]MDO6728236.1 nitrile hydratase accessory protein [Cognatishimia sp. 1_MG-2023]
MSAPEISPQVRCMAEATLPQRDEGEPLFRRAWHARVFTLIVTLVHNGKIPWLSFQERLATTLKTQQDKREPLTNEEIDLQYFDCWLEAAEATLLAEGFVGAKDIASQIDTIRQSVSEIRAG